MLPCRPAIYKALTRVPPSIYSGYYIVDTFIIAGIETASILLCKQSWHSKTSRSGAARLHA